MKKFKKLSSPLAVAILFAVAAALILFGGIGSTMAWNNTPIESEKYAARVEMKDIGVSLMEANTPNTPGTMVSHRDYVPNSNAVWDTSDSTYRLCDNLLGTGDDADEELKIGKKYDEFLTVYNSGTIDEYVRVSVFKYWAEVDDSGNITQKRTDLDPSLIDVNFVTDNGWMVDSAYADDEERTVLYYSPVLLHEEESTPFVDAITIKDQTAIKVEQKISYEGDYKVITNVYEYDGVQFILEAQVDAVQTHNAHDAMLSAWGRDITVEDGQPITAIN